MNTRSDGILATCGDQPQYNSAIAVYGASGHTGRFVVAELQRRNLPVIAIGRSQKKLDELSSVATRVAAIDDPSALDRAMKDVSVVINCAGPFLDTAQPVIEAALRAGASYLDITPEQQSARDTFAHFDEAARASSVKIIPAASFFGGLADLLVRAAMEGWHKADDVRIAIALDSWHPTHGTRETGKRNIFPRVILSNGVLTPVGSSTMLSKWNFPAPFLEQDVTEVPLSEIIAIARDARIKNARSFMNVLPQTELGNPLTPAPVATDALGRSAQMFIVDVIVENDGVKRRARAAGQDIYAVTAPIVVEAAQRIFWESAGQSDDGTFSIGELFEPRGFLETVTASYPGFATEFSFMEGQQ